MDPHTIYSLQNDRHLGAVSGLVHCRRPSIIRIAYQKGCGLTNNSVSSISSNTVADRLMGGKKSDKKGMRCLTGRRELR
jgi:hypothetical protein